MTLGPPSTGGTHSKRARPRSGWRKLASLGLAVGLLGVSALATLEWLTVAESPFPSTWFFAAASLTIVLLPRSGVRLLAVCLMTFAVGVGFLELYWRSGRPDRPRAHDPARPSQIDAVLGVAAIPDRQTRARRWADWGSERQLLYDVLYTVDADGLRRTPRPAGADRCVLFFGGSFVFGSGVEDEETLPFLVAQRSNGTVATYNFGFRGYGPQHMLALIESGRVAEVVACRPSVAVYLGLPDHVARAAGIRSYSRRSPRFDLENGVPVRRGLYVDQLPAWRTSKRWRQREALLRSSTVLGATVFAERVPDARDVELAAALVHESFRLLEESYAGLRSLVLWWDLSFQPNEEGFAKAMEARGLKLLRASEGLEDLDAGARTISEYDGHPNPAAYHRLAAYLSTELWGIEPADP